MPAHYTETAVLKSKFTHPQNPVICSHPVLEKAVFMRPFPILARIQIVDLHAYCVQLIVEYFLRNVHYKLKDIVYTK